MSEPSPLNIALGGEQVPVNFLGNTEGQRPPTDVLVRYIPIRQIHILDDLQTKEPELVEFFVNEKSGWADSLSPQSFEDILAKGRELNFPIRERWLARQMKVAEEKLAQMQALLDKLPEGMKAPVKLQVEALQRQLLVRSALSSSSGESAPPPASPISAPVTPSSSTTG